MLTVRDLKMYALYGEGFLYSRLSPRVPMAAVITEQSLVPGATTRYNRVILLNTDVEEHLEDKREYDTLFTVSGVMASVPVSFWALEHLGYPVDPERWHIIDLLYAGQLDEATYGYELLFLHSLTSSAVALLIDTGADSIVIVYKSPRFAPPSRGADSGTYLIKPAVQGRTLKELLASIVQEAKGTGLPPSEAIASRGFIFFDTSSFLYMLSDRALAPDEVAPRPWSANVYAKVYAPCEPWGRKYAVVVGLGDVVHLGNKRILASLPALVDTRHYKDNSNSWYEVIPPNVRGLYMVLWSQPTGVYPPYPLATLKS